MVAIQRIGVLGLVFGHFAVPAHARVKGADLFSQGLNERGWSQVDYWAAFQQTKAWPAHGRASTGNGRWLQTHHGLIVGLIHTRGRLCAAPVPRLQRVLKDTVPLHASGREAVGVVHRHLRRYFHQVDRFEQDLCARAAAMLGWAYVLRLQGRASRVPGVG